MSVLMPTVFVLLPDYGYQGLREPIMVFTNKEAAEAAMQMISKANGTSLVLAETNLWRGSWS